MPNFVDFLVFVGMVMLRFGIPLLLVVGLAYLLKRLDRRWEAEAYEYAAKQAAAQPEAPRPAVEPELPVRQPVPAPQLPFIIPPAPARDQRQQLAQPGMMTSAADPNRSASRSEPSGKARCSAPQGGNQPCWQTRLEAENKIPDECVSCDIFQRHPVM